MIGSMTWARLYALTFGVLLTAFAVAVVVLGLVSLAATLLGAGDRNLIADVNEPVFGIEHWHHTLLFTLAGIVGLATWRRADSARAHALLFGTLFLLLGAWGLLHDVDLWSVHGIGPWLVPRRLSYDIAGIALGLIGLVAGLASPRHHARIVPAPTTA